MKRRHVLISVILFILGIAVWFFSFSATEKSGGGKIENVIPSEQKIESSLPTTQEGKGEETAIKTEIAPETKKIQGSSLLENVPFTVQAPFGEWNDPIFQNGCEEAALLMSQYWITGETLTKEIAKKEIEAISAFEKKDIGQSVDTSAKDTEKVFRDYYGVTTSEVRTNITLLDVEEALSSGWLVIVPVDGRKLKNPNYVQPGPVTHMLVIIGYDAEKKEFITNDSGTRNGKGYRYKENILFEAIRDYPTGNHLPINGIEKSMIVVRKDLIL